MPMFAVAYPYDGQTYLFELPAKDRADAEARFASMCAGEILGEAITPLQPIQEAAFAKADIYREVPTRGRLGNKSTVHGPGLPS